MAPLLERFRAATRDLAALDGPLVAAVSGGADSLALLDLLVQSGLAAAPGVVVAHVDHGIHPDSGAVAEAVRRAAAGYGLRCEVGRLDLGPTATETGARRARYRWLRELLARVGGSLIVTAHHADDQAETVLLRVLHGSGPAGLAAMAPRSADLARPLLGVRRTELVAHVAARGLPAWEDPANADPRHLRSFLRREILPSLRGRLPDVDDHLLRVAREASRHRLALDRLLDLLPGLDLRVEARGVSVAALPLKAYDSPVGAVLLEALARRVGCPLGPERARRVVAWLARARSGRAVDLVAGWQAELALDRLVLRRGGDAPAPPPPAILAGEQGACTWGEWHLAWRTEPAPAWQRRAAMTAWFPAVPLLVRARRPAERIAPLGLAGTKLVSRCLQEARVPRGRRDRWPVVDVAGAAAWVPGVCRSAAWLPAAGTEAVRIDVHGT